MCGNGLRGSEEMTKMGREPKTDMLAEFVRAPLEVPCREIDESKKSEGKGKNSMKISQFNSCRLSGWIVREMDEKENEDGKLEKEGDEYGRIEGTEKNWKNTEIKRADKIVSDKEPVSGSSIRKLDLIPVRSLRLHWWDESTERSKSDSDNSSERDDKE